MHAHIPLHLYVEKHNVKAALDFHIQQLDKGVVSGLFVHPQLPLLHLYPSHKHCRGLPWFWCQVEKCLLQLFPGHTKNSFYFSLELIPVVHLFASNLLPANKPD